MEKGRPTKYKQAYCNEIIQYFSNIEILDENGKYKDFPTLAGFAAYIGVDKDTLHEWANVHKEFSDAKKKAKAIQEQILVKGAMTNNYNNAFSIFFAKNNLGYKDKPEDKDEDAEGKKQFINEIKDVFKKYK